MGSGKSLSSEGSVRCIKAPKNVASKLETARRRRNEKLKKGLSVSNLLTVAAVREGLQEASVVGASESQQPLGPRATTTRSMQHQASQVLKVFTDFVGGYDDPLGDPGTLGTTKFIAPEVNQKLRQQLLRQHPFTGRFQGSREAELAEAAFSTTIARYHLRLVRRRLLVAAFVVLLTALEPLVTSTPGEQLLLYLALRSFVPSLALLVSALLCFARRTRPLWRVHVSIALMVAYNSRLWGDAVLDISGWSWLATDMNTTLQLVWLLIAMQASAFAFSLDFVYAFTVLLFQWASFAVGTLWLWQRWKQDHKHESHEGADLSTGDAVLPPPFSPPPPWAPPPAEHVHTSVIFVADPSSAWSLIRSRLLVSLLATAMLMLAVHNVWREKRMSFVNSFVMFTHTVAAHRRKHDAKRELLALFSNPSAPQQLHLRPLQLGQELKFLMRSVPAECLVRPAHPLPPWTVALGCRPGPSPAAPLTVHARVPHIDRRASRQPLWRTSARRSVASTLGCSSSLATPLPAHSPSSFHLVELSCRSRR